MKFMLLIIDNVKPSRPPTEKQMQDIVAAHGGYAKELAGSGKLLDGNRLRNEYAEITVKNGKRMVTDGPFAETKEIVGGYYLLECKSREEAVEIARRCPMFDEDRLQLVPIWEP